MKFPAVKMCRLSVVAFSPADSGQHFRSVEYRAMQRQMKPQSFVQLRLRQGDLEFNNKSRNPVVSIRLNDFKYLYCCTVHFVDSLNITLPTNALIVCHLF